MLGSSQAKVSSNVLRQVEQTDLIQYGLIPEFVGRFPVISSLQVGIFSPMQLSGAFTDAFAWSESLLVLKLVASPFYCSGALIFSGTCTVCMTNGTYSFGHINRLISSIYVRSRVASSAEVYNGLQTLTESELMDVLTKPKNALAKQYERMFGMSRARMYITQSARRAIAQAARERGTGARGLRSIMENLLQPVMYDVSILR